MSGYRLLLLEQGDIVASQIRDVFAISPLIKEVDVVASETEALRRLSQLHYDIFCVDLMLPSAKGMKLLEDINDNEKLSNICVLINSSVYDEAVFQKIQNLENLLIDFLPRPFNPNDILSGVKRLIGRLFNEVPK